MNPFDKELSDTMKSLGKQVEAQVPPDLYRVAQLVSTAPAQPLRRPPWQRLRIGKVVEVAAACLLLGSLVGVAAYRNLHGAGTTVTRDACGYRQTIGENLALAAEQLPVPSAVISRQGQESTPPGSLWPPSWETYLREQQAKGQMGYTLNGDEVRLTTWANSSQKDPGWQFSEYRFPRGNLSEQSNVAQIFTQFQAAAAAGNLKVSGATTMVWQISQEEYYQTQALGRYWTLKDVQRWYDADSARPTCVMKTVPVFRDGPVDEVTLPMLDLHNGRFVGFQGESVITYADGEGMFGGGNSTAWYTVPGLQPTEKLSGKSPRKPVQSRAQLQQAEAARKAREREFEALKAEVAKAEADYAAIKVPRLEDVGEATYMTAAQASAEQGRKMKELQVRLGQLQQEMADPMSDEVKLEKAIELWRARLATGSASARNPQELAGLDQIERDYKSGAKPASALLADLDRLMNP